MVGLLYPALALPAVKDRKINWSNSRNPSIPQRVAIETCSPRAMWLVMDSRKERAVPQRGTF